jgi:hypothetical protein
VIFSPKLIGHSHGPNELSNTKELREYLTRTCVRFLLSRKQEKFTDIVAAFDTARRLAEYQPGSCKAVIALSDFKEEKRPGQVSPNLRMSGMVAVLLYRILNKDRIDPTKLDSRLSMWSDRLEKSGAKVVTLSDEAATAERIGGMLCQ